MTSLLLRRKARHSSIFHLFRMDSSVEPYAGAIMSELETGFQTQCKAMSSITSCYQSLRMWKHVNKNEKWAHLVGTSGIQVSFEITEGPGPVVKQCNVYLLHFSRLKICAILNAFFVHYIKSGSSLLAWCLRWQRKKSSGWSTMLFLTSIYLWHPKTSVR